MYPKSPRIPINWAPELFAQTDYLENMFSTMPNLQPAVPGCQTDTVLVGTSLGVRDLVLGIAPQPQAALCVMAPLCSWKIFMENPEDKHVMPWAKLLPGSQAPSRPEP